VNLTYDQLNGGCTGCLPTPVDGTVRYNADNRIAILDPTNPLLSSTEYTAVIEGSGDGDHWAVKDRGGTPMSSDYIWYFTTRSGGIGPGLP
jgi:hypothetical protein